MKQKVYVCVDELINYFTDKFELELYDKDGEFETFVDKYIRSDEVIYAIGELAIKNGIKEKDFKVQKYEDY